MKHMKSYRFEDMIDLLDSSSAAFRISDNAEKGKLLRLYSADTVCHGDSRIVLPFAGVVYGDQIIVDARIRNPSGNFGEGYCEPVYYRGGQRVVNYTSKGVIADSGQVQFYGTGYRDYRYRFTVPMGADRADIIIGCKNGGTIEIRDMEVYVTRSAPGTVHCGIKCVAHQGMRGYAPFNTMPAFQTAARAGFRECVVNINHTRDGYLVVLHDDTIDATANGTGKIHDMTLSEVRQYDFGAYFNAYFTGTEIPTLAEAVSFLAKAGVRPVLRLPSHFTGEFARYLDDICRIVKTNGLWGACTAKAFSRDVLDALSGIAGNGFRYGFCTRNIDQGDVSWIKSLGNDVYFDLNHKFLTDADIELALSNEIAVESWIVNDFETIIRLAEKGVTGFTTDYYCFEGCIL
jgi:glycerophosphoryl diester phosphodiesterase